MRSALLLFILPLLCISCAQVGSPSGGPKDVEGPKVEFASPQNQSVDFKGDRVRLEFDEFISDKGISNELIVTPSTEKKPQIKITGKRLEVIFEEGLLPNTTYTLNFGKSVVDLSEQNPLDSNVWVFSTGSFLDSGKISGSIQAAYDEVLEGEFWVFLYEGNQDSLPLANKPYYLTRAFESGAFQLNFLREGDYKVFALKDDNKNFNYDLPEEKIAFLENRVHTGNDSLKLRAFTEDRALQYLENSKLQGEVLTLAMHKASRDLKLTSLEGDLSLSKIRENRSQDSLIYWMPLPKLDSLNIILNEGKYSDTVEFKREASAEFKLSIPKEYVLGNELKMTSNCPLSELASFSFLRIGEDDTLEYRSTFANNFEQSLNGLFSEAGSYSLKILPDTNSGENCFVRDTLSYSISVLDPAELLSIEFKLNKANVWVELLDEKGRFLKQASVQNGSVKFNQLKAGNFKARLVIDANKNGFWDTGNYLEGLQPESVYYFNESLELKKGFDLVQEWILK
jgi:hypothetical protein